MITHVRVVHHTTDRFEESINLAISEEADDCLQVIHLGGNSVMLVFGIPASRWVQS